MAIEAARAALLPVWVEQCRPIFLARWGVNRPPRVLASQIVRDLAGLGYARDAVDAKRLGNEVIQHPASLLRGTGGDCEDQNLFLAGAIMQVCARGTTLWSNYLPSINKATHVRLLYDAGSEIRQLDLVGGAAESAWDGKGEVVEWK
jgi:hypothetical protein